ncbi:uncharacterized protein [Dysidea avara]|uniref:uncharacterized protein isoform X2 n=1 Tax=Dysidea avara TaxID=196820 RepID=UPI00332EFAB6
MVSQKVQPRLQGDDYTEGSSNKTDLVGDLSDNTHFKEKILFTKACILLPYRYWRYSQRNWHYFFADFCYYIHFLLLAYLWLIPPGTNAGYVFVALYCFCNGPLLWGIIMWKNPLVFHSVDKMTSLYLHISPALVVNSLRWYSIQGYTTCPIEPIGNICNLTFTEFLTYPVICYGIWQVIYYVWVDMIKKEHIKRNNIVTSYDFMTEHIPKGPSYHLVHSCGPQWCKTIYNTVQFGYSFLFMLPCYLFYYSLEVSVVAIMIFISVACWNGAQYTFSKRHCVKH